MKKRDIEDIVEERKRVCCPVRSGLKDGREDELRDFQENVIFN